MSSITSLTGSTPVTTAGAATIINTNFSNLNTDKIETSILDTDTALAANSDTKIATQKAVKAYVDSGGVANASETVKGLVEEATDAEIAAGTATGSTGARLYINPSKQYGAKFSDTDIYESLTEPSTWTDLDLSSVVGVKQKMVMLKVSNQATDITSVYAFRPKSDTGEYYNSAGANNLTNIALTANTSATTIVKTDTNGVIQWKSNDLLTAITTGNTSTTGTHNSNKPFLIVAVYSTTNDVTAVSFNGTALTQIGTAFAITWSSRYGSLWYLSNASQGSYAISVTGGTANIIDGLSVGGVDLENPIESITTSTDETASANPTLQVTTLKSNAFVFAFGQIQNSPSAGSGTTEIFEGASVDVGYKSTNEVSPTGNFTINLTASSGGWRLRGFALNQAKVKISVQSYW